VDVRTGGGGRRHRGVRIEARREEILRVARTRLWSHHDIAGYGTA
jgi:hypothetical protein